VWIALTVGMVTVVALVLAGRRRRTEATTAWAPDPGPHSIASAATSTGDVMEASSEATLDSAPTAQPIGQITVEPAEHPLAMWIRLTIIGVALLAFLAVSLIATKSV
jgi:hypothetical protein